MSKCTPFFCYKCELKKLYAKEKSEECFEKAEVARVLEEERQEELALQKEVARKDSLYKKAVGLISANRFREAIEIFESLGDWKDSKEKIYYCRQQIEEITAKIEDDRIVILILSISHRRDIYS